MNPKACRHFTGIQHTVCELGINYRTVRDETVRPFRYPCLDESCAHRCSGRELPTVEEVAEWNQSMEQALLRALKARTAIVEATDGRVGVSGKIPCPTCGGELRYSVASFNGHIHAACATPDCTNLME